MAQQSPPIRLLSQPGLLNAKTPTASAQPVTTTNSETRFAHRLSNTKQTVGQLARKDKAILLANALFDTESAIPAIPAELQAQGDPGTYIVQAKGPIDDGFRRLLQQAGATIISYVPNNAYLVRASASAVQSLAAAAQIVLPYEPYYKLTPSLLDAVLTQKPLPDNSMLNVSLFADAREETLDEFKKLGVEVVVEERSPFGPVVKVTLPGVEQDAGPTAQKVDVATVARLQGVQIVEMAHSRVHVNDLSRVRVGVSADPLVPDNYLDLTGNGTIVNVNDTGVDAQHPDLQGRVFGDTTISLVDSNGHGTHVAGIIASSGSKSDGVTNAEGSIMPGSGTQFRGMAPGARIFSISTDTLFGSGTDSYLQETAARTNAFISNNSWQYFNDTEYDLAAASYDAAVRDAWPERTGSQPMVYVFAAGNNGGGNDQGTGGSADTIGSPGTAKNVITVGAIEQYRNITNKTVIYRQIDTGTNVMIIGFTNQPWVAMTDSSNDVASFSSRGNVGVGVEGDFGRFKPDLVAPGTFVVSTTEKDHWDQQAYYNPTNYHYDFITDQVVETNTLEPYAIFVPQNAVQLIIRVFADVDLPIYVRQSAVPTTNNYQVLRTNIVSIPPDLASLSPRDTFWNYAIGNPTSSEVSFTIETELVTTNDLGDYLTVLSNMNNTLGPYYRYESGTSMSAADVSGMVALMQEYFEQRLHVTNSPALMKALLINGARPVADRYDLQVNTSINYQGWGLPNLPTSIPTNTDFSGQGASMMFFDQSPTNALATNQKRTYTIKVDPTATDSPLRVTLAWTDPPGNPVTGIKLVNDLDLIVSNYDTGDVYLGNDLLAGSDFNLPWDTNVAPNIDIVNNVENVFLLPPLASKYDITVVGKRVNVNAVTAQTNNVEQDYALVVSCGDGEVNNALKLSGGSFVSQIVPNVLYLTNQFASTPDISGSLLLGQRVGANPTLLGTNTVPVPGSSNGIITLGVTNQWHFYVLSNDLNFTNAAFVTFFPPTLSIPREGVNEDDVNNATRVEADIELYVSTDPNLTNLDASVITAADKSLGRGGTETIIYSNVQPGAVYYVGVKSEDHEAAEYGFFGVFSLLPFGSQDSEGNWLIRGLNVPAIIPDGSPEHPGGAYVMAVSPAPIQLRRVIVTNSITHENAGDLFGSLRHGLQFAVLNNHSFPPGTPVPISYTNIYEDNGQKDIAGSRHTDGPGSLRNFVGDYGFGPWVLTEVDNAPNHTGRVDSLWIKLEKQKLTDGVNVSVLPQSWFYDSIDIPQEATNLTVCISDNGTGFTQPVDLYIRRGDFPTFTEYDKKLTVFPPGGCLSITKYDLPPLKAGRYYVGVFNPNSTAQSFHMLATVLLDLAAIVQTKYTFSAPTPIPDDAVSTSSIFVPNAQKIASVDVGVRIDHPRVSDLVLHLISPSGKRILLFENRGGTTTNGLGGGVFTTNVFPTVTAGDYNANTNTLLVGQNNGILIVDYDFYTIPDDMRVYYDGNRIFDSGMISGAGRFVIDFGPGASSSISIVMNEGGNTNKSTAWTYTATVVSGTFNYLTFTENTNLASLPIKFAPPPFAATSFSTNFLLSGFEPPQPGYYASPSIVDGWNVLTSDEVTVMNNPTQAHTGQQYLSLNQGQIGRTLPTTAGHNYTVRSVSKQPTNCFQYSGFASTADLNLEGNAAVIGTTLRLNPAAFGTSGNAWFRRKQQVSTGFDTHFQFQFSNFGALPGTPIGADGITFTVQNMSSTHVGLSAPTTTDTHVSVFFNTFLNWPGCTDYRFCDYSDNSIGIVVNSAYLQQRDLYPMGINLKDGAVHSAHITYDGAYMNVWLDNAIVLTNVPVSLAPGTDGCGMGWVGFSSASGWAWENQDILIWTFCENAPTFGADMLIPGQITNSMNPSLSWATNTLAFNAKQSGTPFNVFSDKCTSGLLVDTFTFSEAGGDLYYLPEESLDDLIGDNAYGEWKLEIWDNVEGATNPPPQLLGWQLRFVFENDTPAPIVLQHDIAATNTIPTNQIAYFVVDVPAWAKFATNILVSASGPVNLLFNQNLPPTGTGGGDYTLLSASTGGVGNPILSLASVPPLVPGARYYLGIQNSGTVPVTAAMKVDFDVTPLSNGLPVSSVMPVSTLPRYFSYDVSTSAVTATFQLTNLSGNVNLVARKGFPLPAPYDYDYGSFNPGNIDEDIIVFTNSTPVPLSAGTWFLGVFNVDPAPVTYTVVATEYPYPFLGIVTLTNAIPYAGTNLVTPDTKDYYRYAVTTNAVRVQFEINNPSGDVTLVARKGLPVPDLSRYDYVSANPRANDELIVVYDFSKPVRLSPGDWFLTAINGSGNPVTYSIMATEFAAYGTNIVITNSFLSTNNLCLTWTSMPGVHYYIQGKADLLTTNWSVVSPTITAGGYLTTYCIPLPSTNHFFRVHEGIVLDDGTARPVVNIAGLARLPHGLLLQWNAAPNGRFVVEWSPSLTATNWKPFYSSISSSNGVFYFMDDGSQTGGLDAARFYRLKQLP